MRAARGGAKALPGLRHALAPPGHLPSADASDGGRAETEVLRARVRKQDYTRLRSDGDRTLVGTKILWLEN